MKRSTVWAIGCGQLINWGVLYFAFGVLLVPLEQFFGASRSIVAGAFSLGLLVSAFVAPAIGRLADRGRGPLVLQIGGYAAAVVLASWAAMPTLVTTYIAWALLGVCMSAILYEPVFIIVGRAIAEPAGRMRAIATVTVLGGLASTAFLPGTAALVDWIGWRGTAVALGALVATATLIVARIAFSHQTAGLGPQAVPAARSGSPVDLNRLVLVFGISSVVNSAIASNLVAALIDGGFTPRKAATVAGLFGIMQLPGRSLLTRPAFAPDPIRLVVLSFVVQAIGLVALMWHSTATLVAGVIVFAAGAGVTTLARPYWVLQRYGAQQAGYANGLIARAQQIARAFGPVSAAVLAERSSYGAVFIALDVLLVLATLVTVGGRGQPKAV